MARFLVVYIREAHPEDEWQMESNEEENIVFAQPKTMLERHQAATRCCEELEISIPCVVDTMDNRVDELFAAWPERLFILESDGRVLLASEQGPWGFSVEDIEDWLEERFGSRE